MSRYEGKTRIFQFNPRFPLMKELEKLLQKAYTLLPANSRKNFYISSENQPPVQKNPENKLRTLLDFWEKLATVHQLTFNANSKSSQEHGWNGRGTGQVVVIIDSHSTLTFNEKGHWKGRTGPSVSFSNTFRWTLDRTAGVISLEHLRRGLDHPVFLFHLVPTSEYSLSSIHSHLCDDDSYFGQVDFDEQGLRLNWRVIGPKKNETIDYFYH
ncbi:DUF6314 family protein [Candidatus Neptunichlamydia sp. REUL1]|uniref:DUF6314 family protein n=1 Tax=Candidatus Neptunichlamydia sp. REUL1 TaxID=3064277 RepID=UPI00292E67BD|nr:DUF6314 family protein [Candidatus Neptunochlamydia sp. REUL1]